MNPEHKSEGDDPHEIDMDFIVDELCEYMSRLDNQAENPAEKARNPQIDAELESTMRECRSILDFLHESRSQIESLPRDLTSAESFGGFSMPSRIGRFKIIERLGFGGYGVVFRGFDEEHDREVAIKIPRPELLESPEMIQRFAREASIVAQLSHPNIISIYESECYGIVPYIVMAYIPGQTLSEWRASQSQVSPQTAAKIVRDLAQGVAHAHERGVLHRDIKPGNVILASHAPLAPAADLEFVPILTDFGVAQCADLNSKRTQSGALLGTMRYMSPEQAAGKTHEIAQRTDVYGLGTILYELLTGQPPFQSTNPQRLLSNVLYDLPVPPRKLCPTLPAEIELICERCMEKVPANRYPTADEVADDLQRFLSGHLIRARPASWVSKTRQFMRRYPGRTALIGAGFIGLFSTIVIVILVNARLVELLATAETERSIARQNEQLVRYRAYCSDMRNAKRGFDRGNVRMMLGILERYRHITHGKDVRDFVWYYLWRRYLDSSQILGHHLGGANAVAITRQGNVAASGGEDSFIRLWSIPSGELISEIRGHDFGAVESLSFSPEGNRLASAGADGSVRVWDVASSKELFICRDQSEAVFDVCYSARGDCILSGGADAMVRVWNSETGELRGTLAGHSGSVICLAAHPTENIIASGSADATIRLWNLDELGPDSRLKNEALLVPEPRVRPRSLAFEQNGKSLAAGVSKSEILRYSLAPENYGEQIERILTPANVLSMSWPADSPLYFALGNSEILSTERFEPGSPFELYRGHFAAVVSIAIPADGRSLVSASQDGDVRYWTQLQHQSRIVVKENEKSERSDNPRDFSVQWRGPYLVADFQQEKLAVYRMPERTVERTFPKANGDDYALSPSGKTLIISRQDGTATCYRMETGEIHSTSQYSPEPNARRQGACAIDPSDSIAMIATANEVHLLSLQTSKALHHLVHPARVRRILFMKKIGEPREAITTCNDGIVRFWDLQHGKVTRELYLHTELSFSVAVSPDSQFLAIGLGGINPVVRVWELDTLSEVTSIAISTSNRSIGYAINTLAFLSRQKLLIQADSEFTLWDVEEDTEICAFPELEQSGAFSLNSDVQQIAAPLRGQILLMDGRKP